MCMSQCGTTHSRYRLRAWEGDGLEKVLLHPTSLNIVLKSCPQLSQLLFCLWAEDLPLLALLPSQRLDCLEAGLGRYLFILRAETHGLLC